MPAAHAQRLVAHRHDGIAGLEVLDAPHASEMDEGPPVNARESGGVESRLERGETLAQQVRAAGAVDFDVVAGGADPVDRLDGQHRLSAAVRNDEALEVCAALR